MEMIFLGWLVKVETSQYLNQIDPCDLRLIYWFFYKQVHLDYLEAGADIIITASYQVSPFN